MLKSQRHPVFIKPLVFGFLVFILLFIITQIFNYQRFQLLKNTQQEEVNERALKLKEDLQEIMGQSFTATQTLSFIIEHYGIPENFDSIAQLLLDSNNNIDALELVNGEGIITHVYPKENNDVIGFNILNDSIGKDGALTTLKRKDYFTAGPIRLKQGDVGFVTRKPIYQADTFNGFTAAVVRLSTIIKAAKLDTQENSIFSYQLAKVKSDQTEEIFYASENMVTNEAIKIPLTTSHGEWKLYVISNHKSPFSSILLFLILGFLLAVLCGMLVFFLTRQPSRLKQLVEEQTTLLNESQKNYQNLVEQASDGIFLTSSTGVITDVNIAGAKMLGYAINELTGLSLRDIYDPEELKHNPIKFKELKAGNIILHERKMIRKDGSFFYGEINAKMTPNGNLLGILRDITKRKELEQIANNNLQKFSKAFNNSTIGMAIKDENKRFIDANAYFLNLIGFSLEEIKGRTSAELWEFYSENVINDTLSSANNSSINKMEVDLTTTSGKVLHLLTSVERIDYENKKISLCTFIDQTEAKKTTHKLLDLQSKMDAAIRIGKIGYWDWNLKTEIIEWSNVMYEIYDVDPGTIITVPFTKKLVHPDDWEYHNKILQLKSSTKDNNPFSYKIKHRNGSIKYVLVQMEVVVDEKGVPIRYRGTAVDITEQKEADNEIIDLKSKMDAAIRIGKIGYWSWDLESNQVDWSNEMFEIYGISEKTTITLEEAMEFIHPDSSNVLTEVLSRKPDDDQTLPTVYKIFLNDKSIKHILSFSENVYNTQGKPIQVLGTAMDITKRVLAEEALKENKEKFTKAFQTNLMGMIILDNERKVIEANNVVYNLLGVTREGLIGKTIKESALAVMENYDDNEREKFWKHFLKHGKVINQKFKINLKNGQKISLSVSMESLFFKNKQNYLVNLIDDTKRKEAEEALELQNIQLKKANSELDSFVYSASHELRAPLASVLGLINLILIEENEPGLVTNLTMMEKSIKRLDSFIMDIIEYSRNKHLKIHLETINFTNLIESSLENFWYLENMSQLKFNIIVDDKIEFVSDSKRISILLNNFISNAIKYHDLNKNIPTVWVNIKTTKKEAIIEIKDNGLGIAEEQLDKIFNMFYRISSQIMGSGIGLYIVKEVLAKLNGTIEVESELGEGSMFILKIPNESNK
ncbi:PAS domain S-box protein [uncultured Maribacter sp.]|uniref:PAS domain S-box protein n=1 Tax=uncultured Maribacter sp. TaxID=431308 RepID=UPI0030DD53EB|tara:strand:+ start:128 stop:3586 length:3459 start_codon:yes stop_codon:yes gene_type:complete